MSDIPGSSNKIQIEGARFRSPVSEALIQQIGAGINYLLPRNMRYQEWTTPGTYSWAVPSDVSFVWLFGCGGGGGGAGGWYQTYPSTTTKASGGGAGGPAALIDSQFVQVTPNTTLVVKVGDGGAGGTGGNMANTSGSAGADTTFGNFIFGGAPGALGGGFYVITGIGPIDVGGQTTISASFEYAFSQSPWGTWSKGQKLNWGGCPAHFVPAKRTAAASQWSSIVAANGSGQYPGGGGGTGFGPGGIGGNSTPTSGGNAPATSYGAGGGGGGTTSTVGVGPSSPGGKGAGGYLAVVWFGSP